jgi:methanogenic corrinoid protein MtbC1
VLSPQMWGSPARVDRWHQPADIGPAKPSKAGGDCGFAKFKAAVSEGHTIVCLSTLVTTTMAYMRQIVDGFADHKDIRLIVGGAPLTQVFADETGADGYGKDANDAVCVIERYLAQTT